MNAPDAVAVTRELLRFDTVNPPGRERDCARYAGALLEGWGYRVDFHDFEDGRTSVVARAGGKEQFSFPFSFRLIKALHRFSNFLFLHKISSHLFHPSVFFVSFLSPLISCSCILR